MVGRTKTTPKDLDGNGKAEAAYKMGRIDKDLVNVFHKWKLKVHVFTMRDEERHQLVDHRHPEEEYRQLTKIGVDGFFTDFPATAVKALR